jgi:surface polysaccharide O-acyltransferase-like enzyme
VSRVHSVDTMRALAVVAIVIMHTTPFKGSHDAESTLPYILVNQLARFAVPFFFVVSGFFWARKVQEGKEPLSAAHASAKRIGVVLAFWCGVYLLPLNITSIIEHGVLGPVKSVYWNLQRLLEDPVALAFQGTEVHLWFLISLALAVYMSAVFLRYRQLSLLLVVSALFFVIGALGKSYSGTPFGLELEFNTRNGPFFGWLFFATGIWLSRRTPRREWLYLGGLVMLVGAAGQFAETMVLMKSFGVEPRHDYVFCTYLFGVGSALVALSNHAILRNGLLESMGRWALGLYAVHLIFLRWFEPFDLEYRNLLWDSCYWVAVLVLSCAAIALMSRSGRIRRFIQ